MNKRIFLILCCFVLLLSTFLTGYICLSKNIATTAAHSSDDPIIIIDAGHGQEDGGAVSKYGLVEKDINLSIALTLEKLFIQGGFRVEMIRYDDTAIYSSDATDLRSKKVSDIHNRSEICNSSQNNIFISIHQNYFEQSQYSGTQVFYSGNVPGGKLLADRIQNAARELLQPENSRVTKEADSSIYILDKATVPCVLIECGFLSNEQESSKLATEKYRNQIAYTIYSGFLEYFSENYL